MNKTYIAIIVCLGYFVYFNSLLNGFVWDDEYLIINSISEHKQNIFYYFSHDWLGSFYRPLTQTTFIVFPLVFGLHAFPFHFFQITLHIANTIMVFLLFSSLFSRKQTISLLFSLLFLVHPVNVEAVSYISSLHDVYFMFFGLLSLLILIKGTMKGSTIAISNFLLLSSLLSKESGILFFLINNIYIFLFMKNRVRLQLILSLLSLCVYLFLRFAVASVIRYESFQISFPQTIMSASLQERLITIPKLLLHYVLVFIFQHPLAISQSWVVKVPTLHSFYIPLFILIIIFGFLVFIGFSLYKNQRKLFSFFCLFLLWVIAGLLIHIQIIPLNMTVAERWMYFPLVGLLGIGIVVSEWGYIPFINRKKICYFLIPVFIFVISVFSLRTIIRNTNWYSNFTLYKHDIVFSNNSASLHNNLGGEYLKRNDYENAEYHLLRAVELAPEGYNIWHNLGTLYKLKGDLRNAKRTYEKAIGLNEDYMPSWEDLGMVYLASGDIAKAHQMAKKGIAKWSENYIFWQILALTQYTLDQQDDALYSIKKAHSLSQDEDTKKILFFIENKIPITNIQL